MRLLFFSRALLSLAVGSALAGSAPAQTDSPQDEVEGLRRELAALRTEYGLRLAALEARLAALGEAPAPMASPSPTPTPEPSPPAAEARVPPGEVPTPLAAAPTGGEARPAAPLPVYGAVGSKALNPDIGVIGNFVGAGGSSRGGNESLAPLGSLSLQESEVSLQAIVDPYARADFFMAIGEEGIEVEEGYVTFPTLPGGVLLKAGKMRATFGRLNAFHNHTLPWVDRPLVMFNLLGGATDDPDTGIKDAGLSVSRLIPAGPLFLEATAEVFRGDSGTLFQAGRRQDLSAVGRLRAYGDLREDTNLEVGGSYARGHNDVGSGFLTRLYGLDLTLRWRPLRRAIYHSFAARTELIWSRREEDGRTQRAFGGFVSADYRLNRRWFVGTRYDWSDRAREGDLRDHSVSAILTYWPSEFAQVRGQYRRVDFGDKGVANELLFQALFTIGAHGAHPF